MKPTGPNYGLDSRGGELHLIIFQDRFPMPAVIGSKFLLVLITAELPS